FTVMLTTPACPLKAKIEKDCRDAIEKDFGSDLKVDIKMDADVSSQRMSNVNILPSVKNILCVASGKGGVGKSTVTVNIALALAKAGARVGILDADIFGPSIPMMLGIQKGERPEIRKIKDKHYIVPMEAHGVKVVSIGLIVDERQAVVWRGAMVHSALKQFVTDVIWGKLDYLMIDMPPGTGDVQLTMAQTVPLTGSIIVTTPQEVALADARKAIAMFNLPNINIPVVGVVENMSFFTPTDMPDKKYYIFGKDGGKEMAKEYEIPFIGEIPLVEKVRIGGDEGVPVMTQENNVTAKSFEEIASKVAQNVAIENAKEKPKKEESVSQKPNLQKVNPKIKTNKLPNIG
ncbi:MAG TPA: ATP-binding protein, partial [Candidatus Atribacteria bacterium]|nr:ATP-binding protein [Candidatus Atribacteria bacterium]